MDDSATIILRGLKLFRTGVLMVSKQQFRNALKRSIAADRDYADGCYEDFKEAPIHYLSTRKNENESLELIRVVQKINEE